MLSFAYDMTAYLLWHVQNFAATWLLGIELEQKWNFPIKFELWVKNCYYCQIASISGTFVGNRIVDHSDVVGASPVGAAPTASLFLTEHLASVVWAKTIARQDEKHLGLGFGVPYIWGLTVVEK